MKIRYCYWGEKTGLGIYSRFPHGWDGCCYSVQDVGRRWKPELIILNKMLNKKYALITMFHELVHWALDAANVMQDRWDKIHEYYDYLWIKHVRPHYNENIYKT